MGEAALLAAWCRACARESRKDGELRADAVAMCRVCYGDREASMALIPAGERPTENWR